MSTKNYRTQSFEKMDLRHFQKPNYKNRTFRKKKRIPVYEMAKDEARRFCSETGIHGFHYISKPDNTPAERFVWTFISFVALLTALILSTLSWVYSNESPTLVVTDSMQDPIANFLFPGVSICSLNKVSKRKVIEFMNSSLHMENETYWESKMALLAQMYFANYEATDSAGYNELQNLLDSHKITAEEALEAVTPRCKDLLRSCMWKGRKLRCDRLFQSTRTVEGTCCTFNHFALKNRTFIGYMADRYKPFPRKLVTCGHNSGMKVFVRNEPSDYLASELSAYGTKVLIHDPYDYPDWSAQRVLVPMGKQIYADINPTQTYATDDLKALSISERQCVLGNERQLKIFSKYSNLNCITECRISIIGNICGCMPYYYRNEWMDWTPPLRVCSLRDIYCLSANKQRYMSCVPGYDTYQTRSRNHIWGTEKNECNCMADCESRNFLVQSTMGKLSTRELISNKQFYGGVTNTRNYSVISIFFKDLTGTRNKRDVSFTWVTIFGLFGGLLGLCLGFSFIAVVDVIYTFTLRLGINIMRKKHDMAKVKQMPFKAPGFNVLPSINEPTKYSNKKTYNYPPGTDVWFLN